MNTPDKNRYENMKYARCGNSGLMLPKISLGLWHNFGGVDVYENAKEMVLRAFDVGITHLTWPIITVLHRAPPKRILAEYSRVSLLPIATRWF